MYSFSCFNYKTALCGSGVCVAGLGAYIVMLSDTPMKNSDFYKKFEKKIVGFKKLVKIMCFLL